MFSNAFQSGFLSIFYSLGTNPLSLWDKQVKNGHIRRLMDEEVKSLVLEISGTNVTTTYITCPIKPRASLGIKLPFLVMIIKNMKKYFTFEIQIRDDKDMLRRFRVSNFQSTTKVRPFCTTMPIGLSNGWNQVQFNLADFTKRAYGSIYLETVRVQIHANVRIRRIYFADMLYSDEDMPNEFKLYLPGPGRQPKKEKKIIAQPGIKLGKKKQSIGKDKIDQPPPSPVDGGQTDDGVQPSPVDDGETVTEGTPAEAGTGDAEGVTDEGAPIEGGGDEVAEAVAGDEASALAEEAEAAPAEPSEAPPVGDASEGAGEIQAPEPTEATTETAIESATATSEEPTPEPTDTEE